MHETILEHNIQNSSKNGYYLLNKKFLIATVPGLWLFSTDLFFCIYLGI